MQFSSLPAQRSFFSSLGAQKRLTSQYLSPCGVHVICNWSCLKAPHTLAIEQILHVRAATFLQRRGIYRRLRIRTGGRECYSKRWFLCLAVQRTPT